MHYLLVATLFVLPAYVVRFNVLGFPLNFLMVWVFLVWTVFAVWLLYQRKLKEFFDYIFVIDRKLLFLVLCFFFAGIISLFVFGLTSAKMGQFLVLFVQPLSLWLIAGYIDRVQFSYRTLFVRAMYLFLAVSGLWAVVQYFTLAGLPMDWWGNSNEPKRAISFFIHPNFYSLFVTPILAYLIPDVVDAIESRIKNQESRIKALILILAWAVGAVGLLLSLSRGGWLGLAAAGFVYLIVSANKQYLKIAAVAAVLMIVVVVAVPNLRYRLLLPFYGEKSAVARFSLWSTGWKMIHDDPITGKGLAGFNNSWDRYNTDPNLEHYNFPHNIVLNFWVDTGLLGVLSMVGLFMYGIFYGVTNRKNLYQFGLMLALVAIAVHGLIDIPYLKNDLAMVFWLLWGMRGADN